MLITTTQFSLQFRKLLPVFYSSLKTDNNSHTHTRTHRHVVLSVSIGLLALNIPKFNQYQERKLEAERNTIHTEWAICG